MTEQTPQSPVIAVQTKDDAVRLCARLQEAVAQLTDVLGQETQLLKSGGQSGIGDLQEEKLALTRTFLKYFSAFKQHAAVIGASAPSHVERIRLSLRTFGKTVQINLDALEAARAVSQSTVQAIFDVARKANSGPSVYGQPAAGSGQPSSRPTAIAFDQTL